MLELNYSPEVPQALRDHLEFHARRLGLPLHELEDIGQSLERVEAFILAAEAGPTPETARDGVRRPAGMPRFRAPAAEVPQQVDRRARA